MQEFWILILVAFLATNSLDKAESVQLEELEELPLQSFDELFVDEWWDKDEAEDLKTPAPTNFGQNVHYQIDRQNTQLGQIEPNSTDQNPPFTESDHFEQIEPSTDQNTPLTESNHSDNGNNAEEQSQVMNEITSNEKRKIVDKFHAIKDELKKKGKYSKKERNQIEDKIAKHLKVSRSKIYKWKKEYGLNLKVFNEKERKHLVEKFDKMKAELRRAGLKNSYSNQIDKTVAKELGLSFMTIYNWKRELGQSTPNHIYPHNEQKELMNLYYEIKDKNLKISDENIAKRLKIGIATLYKWKKQFKRQKFHQNSVDGQKMQRQIFSKLGARTREEFE